MKYLSILLCLCSAGSAFAAECADDEGKSKLARVIAVNTALDSSSVDAQSGTSASPVVLQDKEVVITFDDGPRPPITTYLLAILDRHCIKATFFVSAESGKAYPRLVQDAAKRGHTIAVKVAVKTVTATKNPDEIKAIIEKSFVRINGILGGGVAPFLRVAGWEPSADEIKTLAADKISLWRADVPIQRGWGEAAATKIANATLSRIKERGHAVVQFDGTSLSTVDALDSILNTLKHDGYKIVHVVAANPYVAATH